MIRITSQILVYKALVFVFMLLIVSNQGCISLCGKETEEHLNKASSAPVIHVVFTGKRMAIWNLVDVQKNSLVGFRNDIL